MKKSTFSPAQIAGILKEFDNGKNAEEINREHGVRKASLYKWRQRYGGMEAYSSGSKSWRKKTPGLHGCMPTWPWSWTMQNTLSKKALKPCDKRMIVDQIRGERPKDIGKACRILPISRSSLHYRCDSLPARH